MWDKCVTNVPDTPMMIDDVTEILVSVNRLVTVTVSVSEFDERVHK